MDKKLSRLSVVVQQGVGDIWWVLQKLAPYAEKLDLKIVNHGNIGAFIRRAENILKYNPVVDSIEYIPYDLVKHGGWTTRQQMLYPLLTSLRVNPKATGLGWVENAFPYSVNPALEAGIPLEKIDPNMEVCWDFGIPRKSVHGLAPRRYFVVYASGDSVRHSRMGGKVWAPENWAVLADRVCYNAGVGTSIPIVVIGSAFDLPVTTLIYQVLQRKGFNVRIEVDLPLPELMWLLGNASAFLGYQSGLNVLAAEAGATQLMVYFQNIAKMGNTFVRPADRDSGKFNWCSFDVPPQDAANKISAVVAR